MVNLPRIVQMTQPMPSSSTVRTTTVQSSGTTSSPFSSCVRYPVTTRVVSPAYAPGYATFPAYYSNISQLPIMSMPTGPKARMGIAASGQQAQLSSNAPHITYKSSSSIQLGAVVCEGAISLAGDQVVEALNVYVGVGPFRLSEDTLEMAPDGTVIARHPNIRNLLSELSGSEPMSLQQLRKISGIAPGEDMWICLPGQDAVHFPTTEVSTPTSTGPGSPSGYLSRTISDTTENTRVVIGSCENNRRD